MLIALLYCAYTSAQNCEAVLAYVRDTTENTVVQSSYYSFKRFFCEQTFSSYQQARDSGVKIGLDIDGLPTTFGGYDKSSQWSQYQHAVCESIDTQSSSYLNIRSYVTAANEKVVAAWSACVSAPGIHFWAEENSGDPSLVTLVATYNGLQSQYEAGSYGISWSPGGAIACDSQNIGHSRGAKFYLNNQRSSVTCTRTSKDGEIPAVNITLKDAADNRTVALAPYSPPPVYNEVSTEKYDNCARGETQLINDGVLGPGTTHQFHFECQEPGYITRYADVKCIGDCGHAYRNQTIAALDGYYNNHTMVAIRYYNDDYKPGTRSYSAVVYYLVTSRVCVAHCKGIPANVPNFEAPLALPGAP
jgi:hypothetical protein